jgi:hypothetical protein
MRRRHAQKGLLLCLLFLPPSPATIAGAAPADPTPADSGRAANPPERARPPRIFNAVRLQGPAPKIDGRFDDAAWNEGAWSGDYIQQLPVEGAAPSVKTELKILYDDRNVYIAIRSYDDPALIHRYPSRRDDLAGDITGVCFDSYFDKRSGFEFDLTAEPSEPNIPNATSTRSMAP